MWSTYFTCNNNSNTQINPLILSIKSHLCDAPRAIWTRSGVREINNPREVGIFRVLDGREGKVGVGPWSGQGGGEREGGEDESSLEQRVMETRRVETRDCILHTILQNITNKTEAIISAFGSVTD